MKVRRLILGLVLSASCLSLVYVITLPYQAFQEVSSTSLADERASDAHTFTNTLGINGGSSTGRYYAKTSTDYITYLKNPLKELGIKNIRYVLPSSPNHPEVGVLSDLYSSLGVRSLVTTKLQHIDTNGVVTDSGGDSYTLDPSLVPSIVTSIGNGVIAVEGPNEYSNRNTYSLWPDPLYTYWKNVTDALKANPATKQTTTIGPTLGQNIDQCLFSFTADPCFNPSRDFGAISSFGNIHSYVWPFEPVGNNYLARHDWDYQLARYNSKPVWITETGANTSTQSTGSWSDGVSEKIQAEHILRNVLTFYKKGAKKIFIYQLSDRLGGSPAVPNDNFGLLRSNGTPKQSYTALKNFLSILSDNSATTPTSLSIGYSALPSTADHLLLQKNNGNFYLVLWNNVDGRTSSDTTVSISVSSDTTSVNEYSPQSGVTPRSVTIQNHTAAVTLSPMPTVVEITSASAKEQSKNPTTGTTTNTPGTSKKSASPGASKESVGGSEPSVTNPEATPNSDNSSGFYLKNQPAQPAEGWWAILLQRVGSFFTNAWDSVAGAFRA